MVGWFVSHLCEVSKVSPEHTSYYIYIFIELSMGCTLQSYITHSLQVEGLRGIVTVPARLESTCLVFVYGVDIFYTRTAPSRTYDSLTEDFSYALLLITIFALVVAIIVTWVLSEQKELKEKWR